MRKIVLLMHVTIDNYVSGPNGELDWPLLDDSLWEYVTSITDAADTAVYGANTYKMMEAYWPTAAEQPDASKHDIEHSRWANEVSKLVFSSSITSTAWRGTTIVRGAVAEEVAALKAQPGKNVLMIGSPSLAHSFIQLGLIDEFRLNIHPVVLGSGVALFKGVRKPMNLKLVGSKTFDTGVIGLTYTKA